ncbi:MAG: hypothetical protein RLZZ54_1405 [Cyanobacteriota bacterium]|jgi:hypothetical protein
MGRAATVVDHPQLCYLNCVLDYTIRPSVVMPSAITALRRQLLPWRRASERAASVREHTPLCEVGAFYWTVLAPDIVNSRREEQGSISV